MAKSWEEILKDTEGFKDDVTVPIGEGLTLTLGDLRQLDKSRLASRQAELDAQSKTLDEAAQVIAGLYEKAEAAAKNPPAPKAEEPPAKTVNDLENDPLFAPVFQSQKALESKVGELVDALGKSEKRFENVVKLYESDRMSRDFRSLSDRPKELTLETLAKYAADNGIKDSMGRLDIERAYGEYRRPQVEEEARQAEYRRGIEEGKKSAAVESAPKPRFSKPPVDPNHKRPGSVREAFDNMRGDSGLMSQLNEALAGLSSTVH